jgi:hypothetical protein
VAAAATVIVALAGYAGADPGPTAAAGEPELRVPWSELRYSARKLLMSAEAVVRVRAAAPERAGDRLADLPADARPLQPSGPVVVVEVESELPFGGHERTTTWLDLASGRALQAEKLATGRKFYWKRKRFTEGGFHQWRAEAKSGAEERLASSEWSKRSESSAVFPPSPDGRPVVDSYGLLYLLAAADLGRAGARAVLLLPADGGLVELEAVAGDVVSQPLDFTDQAGGESVVRSETVALRRVRVDARRVGAGADDSAVDTGLLGIRGGLELLVLADGTPVEISGQAKRVGRVTIHLTERVLADTSPASR